MQFKRCDLSDLPLLQQIAETTYRHTFEPYNTAEDMEEYARRAFHTEQMTKELENPASLFYFGIVEGAVVGYIKLNHGPAQTEIHDDAAIEVERLYLLHEHKGSGYGKALMEKAQAYAVEQGKKYLWLGVWEQNYRALHFYEKFGFYRFGEHPFPMGDDIQTDYLMRKDLV